jgi:hypothetical protein
MGKTASLANIGSIADSSLGFRNRLINSAMVIDQRNAGASVTSGYPVDRFVLTLTQASKLTAQQNAGSITPPAGFRNYLGITSSSAYSVLTGDTFLFAQLIEGFNTSDLGFGTASASTVTLSFRVYSSLTGTFGGALTNSAADRSYPFSYSIPTANTWTTISVTIAGDTSGTWVGATNGIGLVVRFGLGSGATFSGTAGAWAAGNLVQPTGSVSVVGTNGATFYITGVQLEKGSTATSFDYRPYTTELQLCQRYFYSIPASTVGLGGWGSYNGATTGVLFYYNPVTMRTAPSVSNITGTLAVFGVNNTASCTLSASRQSVNMLQFDFSSASSSLSAGYPVSYNGSTAMQVSAEL